MNQILTRLSGFCVMWMCLVAFGCSGDETGTNASQGGDNAMTGECPDGEDFNPILGKCFKRDKGDGNSDMDQGGGETRPDQGGEMPVDMGGDSAPDDGGTLPDQGVDMDDTSDQGDMGEMPVDMASDMTPDQGDMSTPVDMNGDACGYGTILGVACVPSGDALPGAQVTVTGIDCHTGLPFTQMTVASSTGRYELTDVPTGPVEVTLESGSFNRSFTVSLADGEMLDLTRAASKVCIEAGTVKIATISGLYDNVEGILRELQLDFEVKGSDGKMAAGLFGAQVTDTAGLKQTRDFLMDPAAMAQYDVIFINCGTLWSALNSNHSGDISAIVNNLFNYYQSGKSIYASDHAYIFIERPFPAVIDFLPVGGTDNDYGGPLQGYAPQIINANVTSPVLQGILGSNTVAIDFPEDPSNMIYSTYWAMMGAADMNAVVHLTGSATTCQGTGCGSQGPAQSNIPLLVTYKSPTHGGSLAFTSFHNHPEGTPVSPQISKVLKFLIFQL